MNVNTPNENEELLEGVGDNGQGSNKMTIFVIILVLIIIITGIIVFISFNKEKSTLEQIESVSESDELDDISNDIEQTDIDTLHQDFIEIHNELAREIDEIESGLRGNEGSRTR